MGNVRQHFPQTENKQFAISKVFFVVGVLMTVFALAFEVAAPEAKAATGINHSVNYQGRLMDNTGTAVGDGTYQIVFRIYTQESGGTHIWSASTTNGLPAGTAAAIPVQVKGGLFSVLLGDENAGQVALPENIFNNDSLYLGVKIAADSEMAPRKRLSSVPYAFNSETLQGQYASHTVANTGGDLFGLRQASTDAANATRTALYVETKGTSNVYDYLMRLSDGTSDVFSVNRQGDVTVAGTLSVAGQTSLANATATNLTLTNNVWVSGTASTSRLLFINATGTNLAILGHVNSDLLPLNDDVYSVGSATNRWKGVYAVGVTSTNIFANNITATTVSTTNLIINGAAVTTSVPTLQLVTNQGNITNKTLQFAGGTSTENFVVSKDYDGLVGMMVSNNSNGADALAAYALSNGTAMGGMALTPATSTAPFSNSLLLLANESSSGMVLAATSATGTISFLTNSGFGMMINYDGNVGIGNTNPSIFKLQVLGNIGPDANNVYDLGSSSYRWRNLFANNIYASGSVQLQDLKAYGSATATNLYATNNLTVANNVSSSHVITVGVSTTHLSTETLTVNGNTTIGNANTDFVSINSLISSDLVPDVNNIRSLGSIANRWMNLWATNATFTNLYVNGAAVTTSVPTLQQVTDKGKTTSHDIQFAGGTSTGAFRISNNLTVTGLTDLGNALFLNATGSNIALLGYVNSDWSPMVNNTYSLGTASRRWKNAFVVNSYASGTTATQDLAVYGTLNLPNDSITDAMVSDTLTVGPSGNVSATSINSGVLGNAGVTLNLSGFGSVTGTLSASQIMLASTSSPGVLDLQTYLNILVANGSAYGGIVTQASTSTVDVSSGQALLSSDPYDPTATVYYTSWATSTGISIPLNQLDYIYVWYNNGNPIVVSTTTDMSYDFTYMLLAKVYNDGFGQIQIHDDRNVKFRPINTIVNFLEEGVGYIVANGCEVSSNGSRNLLVTSCDVWYAGTERFIPAFDSSGADRFNVYYRDGLGGYTVIPSQAQWDDLNYDDNSGTLAPVGAGEYGVQWVYRREDGAAAIIYGQNSYLSEADALTATPPTNLPPEFMNKENDFLIGAIVFSQGGGVLDVRDLRPTIGSSGSSGGGSVVPNHNGLSGLQGGVPGEYYHLSASGFSAAGALTFSSNVNNNLELDANGTGNNKVIVNNTYAGNADLDIVKGDLQLASTTRITNAGYGYLTGLDIGGGDIVNLAHLTANASSSFQALSFTYATGTYLYLPAAKIDNLTTQTLHLQNITWNSATGTYTTSTYLYGSKARFDNIFATEATFTHLVVMQNTNIQNFTFINATGSNLALSGTVSSTRLISGDATLANTTMENVTMANATAHTMIVDETLRVGWGNFPVVGNSVAQFGGTTNTYLQVNIQNHSTGTDASSDFVATADNGDDSNYYIDLGINGSNYNNPLYSISGPDDGYLLTNGANLTIGTASASTAVIFHAGGTMASDEVMRITSDHYVGIGTSNPSSTLDVVGDGRFSGLLTLNTATTTNLFWGAATGTVLKITSSALLPSDTLINNTSVCLVDGTNCPSGTTPNLQTVTNTGNTTTNALVFAGGTSTAVFHLDSNLTVAGRSYLQGLTFTNATGNYIDFNASATNPAYLTGRVFYDHTQNALAYYDGFSPTPIQTGRGVVFHVHNMSGANISRGQVVHITGNDGAELPTVDLSIANTSSTMRIIGLATANMANGSKGDIIVEGMVTGIDTSMFADGEKVYLSASVPGGLTNVRPLTPNTVIEVGVVVQSDPLVGRILVKINAPNFSAFVSGALAFGDANGLITDDPANLFWDNVNKRLGIGTNNPSSTLQVVGTTQVQGLRFTQATGTSMLLGTLAGTTVTTTNLFWNQATGTTLKITSSARLPSNTKINNTSVCLADGTNCPSSAASNLQNVTNAGNTTTKSIQFAGGTSTAGFRFNTTMTVVGKSTLAGVSSTNQDISGYLKITGKTTFGNASGSNLTVNNIWSTLSSSTRALFINSTGTNFALTGRVNSNLSPMTTNSFNLGSSAYRWKNLFTSGAIYASGTVVAQGLQVYGTSNLTNLQLNNVTTSNLALTGRVNSNLLPMTTDKYVLGNSSYRWLGIYAKSVTSTNAYISGFTTTTNLFWGAATGTTLKVTGSVRLPSNTKINNTSVCLADGTNCPSGTTPNFQTVTNSGNTTTKSIQFAGGTSTAGFLFQTTMRVNGKTTLAGVSSTNQDISGYLKITGKTTFGNASGSNLTVNNIWSTLSSSTRALFINSTGTNIAILGYVNSNLVPRTTNTYSLGTAANRWKSIFAATGIYSSGTVMSTGLRVYGSATTTNFYSTNGVFTYVSSTNGRFISVTSTRLTLLGDLILTSGTNKAIFGTSAFPNRVATTDYYGLTTNASTTFKSGLVTEASGRLLSFAINAYQLGNRATSTIGAIFRMDTRPGNPYWSLKRQPIGGITEVSDFQITPAGNFAFGAGHVSDVPSSSVLGLIHLLPAASTTKVLIVQGHVGQTANLTEWLNGSGSVLGVVNAGGDMGLGTSNPTSKLEVNGNVTIDSAPSVAPSSWANSNNPATGLNSVRSLAVFNNRLYAGTGDSAGDGKVYVCNPAGGGDAALCDNASDWTVAMNNDGSTRINSLVVYKGRLYAAEGNGAGLGKVVFCTPTVSGGACGTGNWATANFPAGPQQVRYLSVYNDYLYATNDTGAAGSASVAACNPATAGVATSCDNASDWNNIALPVAATYETAPGLVAFNGRLYALVGQSTSDNDLFICDQSQAGNANLCDSASDWTRIINNTGFESTESAVVYDGNLYFGQGNTNVHGALSVCDPYYSGNVTLCDSTTKISTVTTFYSGSVNDISAMIDYRGSMFLGLDGATNYGKIMEYDKARTSVSDAGTNLQGTYAFAIYNGVLYAGRGNAVNNGQVWYYRRPSTASYALKFAAGSSTGSVWYSNESYNGNGAESDTMVGSFKFSHGIITEAGAYDLAETYPTNDTSLNPGDVVALDENNSGYIRKTNGMNDKKVLGVVSTKAGFTLSGSMTGDTRPVALVGRVPVKISGENGDVAIGDPLTSASSPGFAMKATQPGMIIGHALESFASSTWDVGRGTGDVATGSIMMVVQTGYYFGDDSTPVGQLASFLGHSTTTQTLQQAFQGDVYAIQQVAGGLVNPQVADGSALNGSEAANIGTLIVRTAALVAGDLTVGGTTRLMGHVVVSDDTAGVVDLKPGEQYVEVKFAKPYETVPVVVVTPESDAQEYFQPWMGKFRIGDKTINGFRIYVDQGACPDPTNCGRTMKFNWLAVGLQVGLTPTSTLQTTQTTTTTLTTTTTTIIGNEPEPPSGGSGTPDVTSTPTTTEPTVEAPLDGSTVIPTSTEPASVVETPPEPEQTTVVESPTDPAPEQTTPAENTTDTEGGATQ